MDESKTKEFKKTETELKPESLAPVSNDKKCKSSKLKKRQKRELITLLVTALVMTIFSSGYYFFMKNRMDKAGADSPTPTTAPVISVLPDEDAILIPTWETTYRVMAHALGGIDGHDYTNSLEAFLSNYAEGTRLFETDFEITSDGKICLTHTWDDFCEKLTDQEYAVLSAEEFKNSKIYGQYTPLLFSDLLELMKKYTDFYVIIDSKRFDLEGTRDIYDLMLQEIEAADPELIHRFIPQAYTPDIYDLLEQEYNFDKIIFTLYHYYVDSDGEKIYQFVKSRKVPVVVMHMDNEWAEKVITDIYAYAKQEQIEDEFSIYIHTVNDMAKTLKIINDYHFFGIYSDFITEKQLKENYSEAE